MAWKPADSSAAPNGEPGASTDSPSARSTVSRPSEPALTAAPAPAPRARASRVVAPREQGAPAALDVEHERAVDQHDERAGLATRAVSGRGVRPGGAGHGSAAPYGLRRVGGGEHDRVRWGRRGAGRGRTCAAGRPRRAVANWAAAETLDEVAAAAPPASSNGRAPGRPRRSRQRCRSAATDPRVTTPCRSSSWSATARAPAGSGRRRRSGSSDHRPAVFGGRGPGPDGRRARRSASAVRPAGRMRRAGARSPRADEGAQRGEGVVGDMPGPDEVPQGLGHARRRSASDPLGAGRGRTTRRRRRAPRAARGAASVSVTRCGLGQQQRRDVGRQQREPAVAARAAPRHRPRRPRRRRSARRASRASSRAPGRAAPASPAPTPARRRRPAARPTRSTPSAPRGRIRRRRPCQAGRNRPASRRHRLDLLAQPGQRAAPQHAQHLGVAPLGAAAAGPELAADHPAGCREPRQRRGDDGDAEPEARRGVGGVERAVGAGVAGDQVAERVGDRLGERLGHADRQRRCRARRAAAPASSIAATSAPRRAIRTRIARRGAHQLGAATPRRSPRGAPPPRRR